MYLIQLPTVLCTVRHVQSSPWAVILSWCPLMKKIQLQQQRWLYNYF